MGSPFVFDSHVDTLQLALDMGVDLVEGSPGQLDLPRARDGGLGAVVMTAWVHPRYDKPENGGSFARAEKLVDELDGLANRASDQVLFIRNRGDWQTARAEQKLALLAGMEGGHPIECSLEKLDHFFERGLRVLTLVWNNHLPWVRSCEPDAGSDIPEGLSVFGRAVVVRLNELGIVVDVSHCGERSFYDALETTNKPVIASHSACSALNPHQRNLDDEQLRTIRDNGGVVGVPFLPSFLDRDAQEASARLRAGEGYRSLVASNGTELEVRRTEYMSTVMPPLSVERFIDHIEHIAEVAGIEHVGLGSDFDGITTTVEGLSDASGYQSLVQPLRARGFSEADITAVCGGNMERVLLCSLPDESQ